MTNSHIFSAGKTGGAARGIEFETPAIFELACLWEFLWLFRIPWSISLILGDPLGGALDGRCTLLSRWVCVSCFDWFGISGRCTLWDVCFSCCRRADCGWPPEKKTSIQSSYLCERLSFGLSHESNGDEMLWVSVTFVISSWINYSAQSKPDLHYNKKTTFLYCWCQNSGTFEYTISSCICTKFDPR